MKTLFDATVFFQITTQSGTIEHTGGLSVLRNRVAIAFQTVLIGQTSVPNSSLKASIIHEIGHNLDAIWNFPSFSKPWTDLVVLDYLDLSFITNPDGSITQRPCLDVFHVFTCLGIAPAITNEVIFKSKFQSTPQELFAEIFEHRISNSSDSELEFALTFFTSLNSFMDDTITNGHP